MSLSIRFVTIKAGIFGEVFYGKHVTDYVSSFLPIVANWK